MAASAAPAEGSNAVETYNGTLNVGTTPNSCPSVNSLLAIAAWLMTRCGSAPEAIRDPVRCRDRGCPADVHMYSNDRPHTCDHDQSVHAVSVCRTGWYFAVITL